MCTHAFIFTESAIRVTMEVNFLHSKEPDFLQNNLYRTYTEFRVKNSAEFQAEKLHGIPKKCRNNI